MGSIVRLPLVWFSIDSMLGMLGILIEILLLIAFKRHIPLRRSQESISEFFELASIFFWKLTLLLLQQRAQMVSVAKVEIDFVLTYPSLRATKATRAGGKLKLP